MTLSVSYVMHPHSVCLGIEIRNNDGGGERRVDIGEPGAHTFQCDWKRNINCVRFSDYSGMGKDS